MILFELRMLFLHLWFKKKQDQNSMLSSRVQYILTIEASIKAYLFIIIISMMTQKERKEDRLVSCHQGGG